MSYKTILVHVDTAEDLARVMPAALTVARQGGAHVIGLHVIRDPVPTIYSPYQVSVLTDAIGQMIAGARERAGEMRKTFEQMIGEEVGVDGEWRTVVSTTAEIDDTVVEHARCADLLIMAQPDPEGSSSRMIGTVGRVMLQAGRPVLVVPYAGRSAQIGDYVMVAWNGSRESTRAVHDALPFMQKAREVRLYAVDGPGTRDGAVLPGAELATTLSRHGVTVMTEAGKAGGSVADTLLSRAADHGTDLLVMGGYGHSRAREYVFGGVTRTILATMTVPVLFSH